MKGFSKFSYIIAALLLVAVPTAFAGKAVIFSGTDVRALKSTVDLNSAAKIQVGSADPRVSAPASSPQGSIYLRNGAAGGSVFTHSSSGSDTNWRTLLDTVTGWSTTGNTGTNAALNFIGTLDANDLVLRTNSTEQMRVKSTGPHLIFNNPAADEYSFEAAASDGWGRFCGGRNATDGACLYLYATGAGGGDGGSAQFVLGTGTSMFDIFEHTATNSLFSVTDAGVVQTEGGITHKQLVAPVAPAAGYNRCYTKADNKFYCKNSAGVETLVGPYASALTNSHILVGDATNTAADVAMSGDATIANTGAVTLASTGVVPNTYARANVTVDAKGRVVGITNGSAINASALNLTHGSVFIGNVANVAAEVALSGDATVTDTGAVTLANSGAVAGTYTNATVTVDTKGRVTSVSAGSGGSGSSTLTITTKVANYTLTNADDGILANGSLTLTLQSSATALKKMYWIKNIGPSTITISAAGGDTYEGLTSQMLSPGLTAVIFPDGGTSWYEFSY